MIPFCSVHYEANLAKEHEVTLYFYEDKADISITKSKMGIAFRQPQRMVNAEEVSK
jgi:hypothetical protein